MTNTMKLTPEEQRRQLQQEARDPAIDKLQSPSEIDQRHYAPLHTALPNDASGYEWKRETGDIQKLPAQSDRRLLHIYTRKVSSTTAPPSPSRRSTL